MKLSQIIKSPRIALDTTIFLDALDTEINTHISAKELLKQFKLINHQVFTSALTLTETTVRLFEIKDKERIQQMIDFVTGNGLIQIVSVDQQIALKAAQIRAEFKNKKRNLKTPDSIQLASAIATNCSLFITNDKDFPKITIEGVKIVHLTKRFS